jgi:hypothetical protein
MHAPEFFERWHYARHIVAMSIPDLTQRPPRSARVKLGGYVILPRILDVGRAYLAGKAGEYNYGCPLDQEFFSFTGLTADGLLDLLKVGKSDTEVLAWTREHSNRTGPEIMTWSKYQAQRSPSDAEGRSFYNESVQKIAPHRDDLITWFDLLDLDDYASFGGQV